MYDYGFRNYDPAIGRWVNIDPLLNDLDFKFDPNDIDEDDDDEVDFAMKTTLGNGGGIFNTDNLNPYSYGYNDPIRFDDPDGRCPICVYVVAALLYSEFANAPSGNAKTDSRNYNDSKSNKALVSGAVLAGGARAILTNSAKAKVIEKTKSNVTENAKKGKEFEKVVTKDLKDKGHKDVAEQVTVRPNDGKGGTKPNVRLDNVSKKDGKIKLTDAKSSQTAGHTKNQKGGYPAIEAHGGTVVGNKGAAHGYPAGTKIPPTKVDIIRPNQ